MTKKTMKSSFQMKSGSGYFLFSTCHPPFSAQGRVTLFYKSFVLYSKIISPFLLFSVFYSHVSALDFQSLSPVFRMTSGYVDSFFFFPHHSTSWKLSRHMLVLCFSSLHCQLSAIHTWSFPFSVYLERSGLAVGIPLRIVSFKHLSHCVYDAIFTTILPFSNISKHRPRQRS